MGEHARRASAVHHFGGQRKVVCHGACDVSGAARTKEEKAQKIGHMILTRQQ